MDHKFPPTGYWTSDYLSRLGLKLIHDIKKDQVVYTSCAGNGLYVKKGFIGGNLKKCNVKFLHEFFFAHGPF